MDSTFPIGAIDRTETIVLNSPVKISGIFILIAIILTAVSPLKPSFPESHSRNYSSFFTLDFCHKAGQSALPAVDVPTFCEKNYELLKLVFTGPYTVADPIFCLYQCVLKK